MSLSNNKITVKQIADSMEKRSRKEQRDTLKAKTFTITGGKPKLPPIRVNDADKRLCEARRRAEYLRDELELKREIDYL